MAAIKTYAVLENHNESNRNEPYSYFVFPSLRELRNCKELNEYSIVFSNVEQLQNTFTEQELLSVLEASNIQRETTGYFNSQGVYKEFHTIVAARAKKYKPVEKETKMQVTTPSAPMPTPTVAVDTPKPERNARAKYDPQAKIVTTGSNPYREGSNRWHNFEALAKSATVTDALSAMKALTPGGNSVDIKLALAKGVIKLGD